MKKLLVNRSDTKRYKNSSCNGTVNLIIRKGHRYGNQLFIYFVGRLFAEKYGLNLLTSLENTTIKISKNKNFGKAPINNKKYILTDSSFDKNTNQIKYSGSGDYYFNGYFQYETLLYANKELVDSYVDMNVENKNLMCLHLRLDDYFNDKRHLVISIDYYIDCIKKYGQDHHQIVIVCDQLRTEWEKEYMTKLKAKIQNIGKKPIFSPNTIENDINIITSSDIIITSNSTFCFWPVFFSKASKIVSFPYMGYDVSPNNKVKEWDNKPIIFKQQDDRHISNTSFSANIIDYFESLY